MCFRLSNRLENRAERDLQRVGESSVGAPRRKNRFMRESDAGSRVESADVDVQRAYTGHSWPVGVPVLGEVLMQGYTCRT